MEQQKEPTQMHRTVGTAETAEPAETTQATLNTDAMDVDTTDTGAESNEKAETATGAQTAGTQTATDTQPGKETQAASSSGAPTTTSGDTQNASSQHTQRVKPLQPSARYRRLVTSSSTALAHAVKSLTYKRVAACYPSIAKTQAGQDALREALKQICKAWQDSVQTEFDAIFEERHLHEKLAQLDQLVKEAKLRMNSNTELPIHVDRLTPDQIIKSHLRETKLARIKKLKQLAETVKKENDVYRQKIKDNTEQVHASLDKLHKVTSDISKATTASHEMPERAELYESWNAL